MKRPIQKGRRSEIPSGREFPDKRFLADLARFDRNLELLWHPTLHRWELYSVLVRGAGPSDDVLVHEMSFKNRQPGHWLMPYLQQFDKTRNGVLDNDTATDRYLGLIEAAYDRAEAKADREFAECRAFARSELLKYGTGMFGYGRTSCFVPKGLRPAGVMPKVRYDNAVYVGLRSGKRIA